MVWYGMAWYAVVGMWCGVVWYVNWYGMVIVMVRYGVMFIMFNIFPTDICCSPKFSTEDSIRNLDVFLGLCSQYFCTSVLALKIEDILYASPSLKINIVALLAEMFLKCEGNVGTEGKPGIPRSKTSCSENGDVGINGHDNGRSHSAPIARLEQLSLLDQYFSRESRKHEISYI